MSNKTNYNSRIDKKRAIIYSIILTPISLFFIYLAIKNSITEITKFNNVESKVFEDYTSLIFFLFAYFIFFMIGLLLFIYLFGIIKGKKNINKENKKIKHDNPYIYMRELPNDFGIGVVTLLFDSKIENYKDIVAIILDLCARKYLYLNKENDKYAIKVLKGIDNNLLSNEKYIMGLIISNELKNINYNEWFDYCMQDGINLGLYCHDMKKTKRKQFTMDTVERRSKKKNKICLIISCIFSLAFLTIEDLFSAILDGVFIFIFLFAVSSVVLYIVNCINGLLNIGANTFKDSYENEMNNKLTRTQKGITELQKLYSFEAFLKDFGNFVSKKPEEVILWDRYLSYAQVFGLTKEIMNSGYNEIINNSSFIIDNIDNINFNNIEIK